jgi:hypothetical protein
MYVTYDTSGDSSCPDTLSSGLAAYTVPCMLDITTNRPAIIALNFCGAAALKVNQTERLVAQTVQQLLHSLVGPRLSVSEP